MGVGKKKKTPLANFLCYLLQGFCIAWCFCVSMYRIYGCATKVTADQWINLDRSLKTILIQPNVFTLISTVNITRNYRYSFILCDNRGFSSFTIIQKPNKP